jgi:hypothetical protein
MLLDEERSLQKNGGCSRPIALTFGVLLPAKKQRKNQLKQTTRDFRSRVAKCVEVDGGLFENIL